MSIEKRCAVSPPVLAAIALLAQSLFDCAVADDVHPDKPVRAASHAPIGVMGEHMHKAGEWMLSYRYMNMDMAGTRIGDDRVSPDSVVTTVANRFFGAPMQPPTLRVVPTEMTMEMHMFGAMYAPTDWVTLMLMANYISKEMDHITYMGGMGTTVLGTFTTESDGIGDTAVGGLFRIHDSERHKVHLNLGITIPTGDIEETDTILTPMGGMPTPRLPYSMQLGSGSWDLRPGLTYNGRNGDLTWGAQYIGTFPLGDNDESYQWGEAHEYGAWFAWSPRPWISSSLRVLYQDKDAIEGIDPMIVAPVQTADPANYGGETLFGYVGVNLAGQRGFIRGHRLALEAGWPLDQNLNGPQMETDFTFTAGWQFAF